MGNMEVRNFKPRGMPYVMKSNSAIHLSLSKKLVNKYMIISLCNETIKFKGGRFSFEHFFIIIKSKTPVIDMLDFYDIA